MWRHDGAAQMDSRTKTSLDGQPTTWHNIVPLGGTETVEYKATNVIFAIGRG